MAGIDHSEVLPALGKTLEYCFAGKRYKLINVEWYPMQECQAYTLVVVTADDQITREFHATFTHYDMSTGCLLSLLERFRAQIEYFWEGRYKMIDALLGRDKEMCEYYPNLPEGGVCYAGAALSSFTTHYQDGKNEWHQYTCSKEYSKDCPHAIERRKPLHLYSYVKAKAGTA